MLADDIPVAHTPEGGYGDELPPPVLTGCDEPLPPGAPDMRGTWRIVEVDGQDDMIGHLQRIEQCGDRVVVTSGGVVHDMRADGSVERGVHDVTPAGDRITVVATFEDGVHVLRPEGLPGIEVTRHLEGDQLVWRYGPLFTARLERRDPE